MKPRASISRVLAPLCLVLATQAHGQGVAVMGPAAVYQLIADMEAIVACVASERAENKPEPQRLADVQRCLDQQEAAK